MLDTGAPFYDVYEMRRRRYIAVGAIEPQFYAELLALMGLDADEEFPQMDQCPLAGAARSGSPRCS